MRHDKIHVLSMFVKHQRNCSFISYGIGFALIMLMMGCGVDRPPSVPQPTSVSVRLKGLHQVQFAGMYVAQEEGYYAEEGLTVTFDPVALKQQLSYEKVLAGENDIGVGAPEELIIARSQGKPVKAIAVVFQLNPVVFMAPKEAGINSPDDFVGKTIALSPGQGTIMYEAMMANLYVDRTKINETQDLSYFFKKCWESADVCVDYATNGLAIARHEGLEFTAIWPAEYGVSFYGDVIFTTDEFIEKHPDVVERFVRATLKGWQKAADDPELGTTHTLAFDGDLDKTLQLSALEASLPLIDTGQDQIGRMNPVIWQQMYDILLEQGFITEAFDVTTVYTNEFVEKAYAH
jgi:NitT/TauT family transport system substrate-binding protein